MAESGGTRDLLPQGEGLSRALRWLDERIREEPGASRVALIGQAAVRFDLGPVEEEFLLRNWAAR